MTSSDPGRVSVSPSPVVFAETEWMNVKTATVTTFENSAHDLTSTVTIAAIVTSAAEYYHAFTFTITVNIIDNDPAPTTTTAATPTTTALPVTTSAPPSPLQTVGNEAPEVGPTPFPRGSRTPSTTTSAPLSTTTGSSTTTTTAAQSTTTLVDVAVTAIEPTVGAARTAPPSGKSINLWRTVAVSAGTATTIAAGNWLLRRRKLRSY